MINGINPKTKYFVNPFRLLDRIKGQNLEKIMKTEETSSGASAPESPKPAPKPEKTRPSKIQALAQKIGLWLLFLLIGALAVTLALYLPTQSKLTKAQAEVERLAAIEAQYNELLPQYQLAQAQTLVYKTISDASLLRAALLENDTSKASQQTRYLEDDLATLNISEYPEILQRLQSQFDKLKSADNTQQSLAELDEFYKDLLLLADNLR